MFTVKNRYILHQNLLKRNWDPCKSVHPALSMSPLEALFPFSSRGVSSKPQGTRFWLFLGLRVEVLRKALGKAVDSLGSDIGCYLAMALTDNSNFDFSILFRLYFRRHNLDPHKAIKSSKRSQYLDILAGCTADHNFDNCLGTLGHLLADRWQASSENWSTGF